MYAKVIVDVSANPVNRPFLYRVPEDFKDLVEIGMRVEAPFGPRTIQGFIVELTEQSDYQGEILEFYRPMDLEPVLTKELVALGNYMSQEVFAFQINCYQTMLPPMLKTTYEKRFYPVNGALLPAEEQELFAGQDYIVVDTKTPDTLLAKLLRLKAEGKLSVRTIVGDKVRVKKEKWLLPRLSQEEITELMAGLPSRSVRQKNSLEAILTINQPVKKSDPLKEFNLTSSDMSTALKKGWVGEEERQVNRDPFANRFVAPSQHLALNDEQDLAFKEVVANWDKGSRTYLLEGVTGSGKTELYLQWIAKAIEDGKSAIMLVPEIALTPQMVHRFKSRFGNRVAILHSGLSAGEKYDEWRKIHQGQADIVVGARSSIFAPLKNIGIIILDEEHETTYKQDESPRYHARDIALWRAKYHDCPLILGSATPSLDSRARAQKDVYKLLKLNKRAKQQNLPQIQIVDMRQEFQTNRGNFSGALKEAIAQRLDRKEQTVLLLNRRGYSSFVLCRDCGHVVQCPNCDISLTMHMDTKSMKCHYCGHEEAIPNRCPKCLSEKIRYYGTGTQKVEEELQDLFPAARIIRMDVDTTRKKGQHEKLLQEFGNQEADILLGTQMIAKGLDFPKVTLVGVINADTSLNLPDFRSFERTFQLLTQVAGRAGRADLPGQVIIQSFNPDHYAIEYSKNHDYEGFFRKEMSIRHLGNYPPYFFTTMVTVSSETEALAMKKAVEIRRFLTERLSKATVVLGPTAKSIARVNKRYYFQILIKYKKEPALSLLLNELMHDASRQNAKKLSIQIDIEPMQFL